MLEKKYYKVDFSNVKELKDIHDILDESLSLFDYYCNLDSLYDCLTDLLCEISFIEIIGLEKLKKFNGYDKKIIEVFYDAKHDWGEEFSDRFLVTIVHDDGTKEELK